MRRVIPAVLLAWAALAVVTALLQPWTVDDAFISFRYAENLAHGHGLVYNPGEWVEGYTSTLWVLILAVAPTLGGSTPLFAKVLGVAFTAAIPLVLATAPRWSPLDAERPERGRVPVQTAIAVAVAGTAGPGLVWAAGGMEVPLVVLLTLLTWVAFLRIRDGGGAALAGVLAGLCWLARPDAALVGLVQVGALAISRRWRWMAALILGALVIAAPHEAWRWTTYGYPFPNTFYAKVGTTGAQILRGLDHLGGFALAGAPLLLGLGGLRERALRAPLAWAMLHALYVVAVGGDVLPGWRFFAVIVPILALGIGSAARGRLAWLAVPLVAWQLVAIGVDPEQHRRVVGGHAGRDGLEVGAWLAANFPPDTLLATNAAGAAPYASGFRTIDMLGLCDAHIAHRDMPDMGKRAAGHEKADGAYVLGRAPDVVLFGGPRGRETPFFTSDRELYRLPGFRDGYTRERHVLPSGEKLVLWRRNASKELPG